MDKQKKSTSAYLLFRKLLVSKGHKLAKKDIGALWGSLQLDETGTKSSVSLRTKLDEIMAQNVGKTDGELVQALGSDDVLGDGMKTKMYSLFAGLKRSRENDIQDRVTDARTVVRDLKPKLSKSATTPIPDSVQEAINSIIAKLTV